MPGSTIRSAARQGAYEAARAAALSGVPKSTLYDWHKKGIVVPSIRPSRLMLWSYEDLLTLRLVRWLRLDKPDAARSSMTEVRRALDVFGDDLWTDEDAPTIGVAPDGSVVHIERAEASSGQVLIDGMRDLLAKFEDGVDLRAPRPALRIVPGRCGSEIHLVGSRLTSLAVHALSDRGYGPDDIGRLYPEQSPAALAEAVDVESELAQAA